MIFGIALKTVGPVGEPIIASVNRLTEVVFKVLSFVMKAAPLGAFGAMAFAIGKFGLSTLTSLGSLILLFYVTSIVFVVVVLGAVLSLYVKLNLFQLLRHFKEELLLVLGTSTAEPALPGLMRKLQFMGVDRSTVGLVVPTGYSFNLDGAAIYLSLATLYIAQATDTTLSLGQQLGLLAVMLLTSKGAAGVAGGGFIALTATLSTVGHVPVAGIMLIFGIDKFMSECRALVNFCGNAVATLVVARWENALDLERARRVLTGRRSRRCPRRRPRPRRCPGRRPSRRPPHRPEPQPPVRPSPRKTPCRPVYRLPLWQQVEEAGWTRGNCSTFSPSWSTAASARPPPRSTWRSRRCRRRWPTWKRTSASRSSTGWAAASS